MRRAGTALSIIALSSGTAANAVTPSDAFECTVPYQAAMEAMASLTIAEQISDPGMSILDKGPAQIIKFAPDTVEVFGVKPKALTLTIREPAAKARKPLFKITFEASFEPDPNIDKIIQTANVWHLGACAFGLCIRAKDSAPAGSGGLDYYRSNELPVRTECVFEFTEEEVNALGS
ncbi:MAG: hypothetical protein WAT93_03835 [Pontixanthobacter sp.]